MAGAGSPLSFAEDRVRGIGVKTTVAVCSCSCSCSPGCGHICWNAWGSVCCGWWLIGQ
jgi:hypothetical protein